MAALILTIASVVMAITAGQDLTLTWTGEPHVQEAWIAAAISAAASIANGVLGSAKARKERRQQLAYLDKQKKENRDWYNRRYYEDGTQRADAQRMITRTNDAIKKRTQAAYGRKAVVGGTDATLASTQQANAEAMGNALGDIVANSEARKDNIEAQYRERQQQLEAAKNDVNTSYSQAQRQNMANAATGVMSAAASIAANGEGSSSTGKSKMKGSYGTEKGVIKEGLRKSSLESTNAKLAKYGGSILRSQEDPWKKAIRTKY